MIDARYQADPMDPKALRPFQREFIAALESDAYDEVCLSLPRGAGKSWLSAHILARCLSQDDRLNVPGAEYQLCAASLDQARIIFRFLRAALDRPPWQDRWRWQDSSTKIGVVDKVDNTRVKVVSSQGKTSMGLVGVPLVCCDEPAAWVGSHGAVMRDALASAIGKPGDRLKVCYVGTLAPALPQHWWPRLVEDGTAGRTYVKLLQGDPEKWDDWDEIRRVNPLVDVDPRTKRRFKDEIKKSVRDDVERARWIAYRLNNPSMGSTDSLCTVAEWRAVGRRKVRGRGDYPAVVGVDLGAGRSWSAAVAVWTTGRMECFALAPGLPGLREQEKRDKQPANLYTRLAAEGSLLVDPDVRMQRPAPLVDEVFARWGDGEGVGAIVCDRFRAAELLDAVDGRCPVQPRVSRYSEASADVQSFRKAVRDGPLSMPKQDWSLMFASLAQTTIRSDERGLYRIEKSGAEGTGRDDVAAAGVLAAGLMDRRDRDVYPDGDGEVEPKEGDDGDAQDDQDDGPGAADGMYRVA